jgi:hypothetical protein
MGVHTVLKASICSSRKLSTATAEGKKNMHKPFSVAVAAFTCGIWTYVRQRVRLRSRLLEWRPRHTEPGIQVVRLASPVVRRGKKRGRTTRVAAVELGSLFTCLLPVVLFFVFLLRALPSPGSNVTRTRTLG